MRNYNYHAIRNIDTYCPNYSYANSDHNPAPILTGNSYANSRNWRTVTASDTGKQCTFILWHRANASSHTSSNYANANQSVINFRSDSHDASHPNTSPSNASRISDTSSY